MKTTITTITGPSCLTPGGPSYVTPIDSSCLVPAGPSCLVPTTKSAGRFEAVAKRQRNRRNRDSLFACVVAFAAILHLCIWLALGSPTVSRGTTGAGWTVRSGARLIP